MSFKITQSKGFWLTFDNGLTISVQFGFGNYASNRDDKDAGQGGNCESKTAEIAIWDADNNWFEFGGQKHATVEGYVTVKDVAMWISRCALGKQALGEFGTFEIQNKK